jgi:hypothetical protein
LNLLPLVRKLSILDKRFQVVPFEPNWAQLQVLRKYEELSEARKPVRLIVLKARQLGISTMTEALIFLRAKMLEGTHGLVVAHENDSSEHLFAMTRLFWETYPWRSLYTPKYLSRKEMAWQETQSTIRIATAKNIRAGRGRTLASLHASEVGFWDRPTELMLGLHQSVPTTPESMIVMESTANGVGNYFYQQWKAAETGENEYVPLFFPWWQHPEYTANFCQLSEKVGDLLNEEERLLSRIGVDEDHLAWRRYAIRNLCGGDINQFHQEYPSSPDEAFIVSGTNVFPLDSLRIAYQPMDGVTGFLVRNGDKVDFKPERSGPLKVFRKPSPNADWGRYYIGGDPSRATYGDYACGQVINRRTFEQVAIYRRKIDPMSFAEELAKLGQWYNQAGLATENEGPGYSTIGRLIEINYPYLYQRRFADKHPGKIAEMYGWSTTFKTKEWAIGFLIKLLTDRSLVIHDEHTFGEMRDYITLPNGGYGPADTKTGHDDTVMAMAISCICAATEGAPEPFSPAPYTDRAGREQRPIEPGWMADA